MRRRESFMRLYYIILICMLTGCQVHSPDLTFEHGTLPSLEQIDYIRVASYYQFNSDKRGQGILDAGDLAWMRRMRNGTATRDDFDDAPHIRERWGTVLDICDRQDIEAIVRLMEQGLLDCQPTNWGAVLYTSWARIYIDWRYEQFQVALVVHWWTEDDFLIAHAMKEECVFHSPELAKVLIDIAQKESLHTWEGSNPELRQPIKLPEWHPGSKWVEGNGG